MVTLDDKMLMKIGFEKLTFRDRDRDVAAEDEEMEMSFLKKKTEFSTKYLENGFVVGIKYVRIMANFFFIHVIS